MALIQCPECKQEISDQCITCVHCGYPIAQNNGTTDIRQIPHFYQTILRSTDPKQSFTGVTFIVGIKQCSVSAARQLYHNTPCVLLDGLSYEQAIYVQELFDKIGATIVIEPDIISTQPNASCNIVKRTDGTMGPKQQGASDVIICPRCGSTSITTGRRGVTFTTGLLGANKTVNRCANCGYKWTPSIWTAKK